VRKGSANVEACSHFCREGGGHEWFHSVPSGSPLDEYFRLCPNHTPADLDVVKPFMRPLPAAAEEPGDVAGAILENIARILPEKLPREEVEIPDLKGK
jgi:hypothetical protein